MISDKIKLEYDAIQSLQDVYSQEDGDDIDDFNKTKNTFLFSGWESPDQQIQKSNLRSSQFKKQINLSFDLQQQKSTLCHLGENIQRYHKKAVQLKKLQGENSEINIKLDINTIQGPKPKEREQNRKNLSSLLVDMPIECFFKQYSGERRFSGNLTDYSFQFDIKNNFSQRNQDNLYNIQQKQISLQSNQQYTKMMQSRDFISINSNQQSRQSIKKQSNADQKQEQSDSSHINLYCIEENLCSNKELKVMFNTLWKKQDQSLIHKHVKSSLEKIDFYSQSQPRKTSNYTETFSINTNNDTLNDDNIEEQYIKQSNMNMDKTLYSTKDHKLNPRNYKNATFHLKNIPQKKQTQTSKDINNLSLFDSIKIQSYYDSELSTQDSARKSSFSSISKNKSTIQRHEQNEIQNSFFITENKEDLKYKSIDCQKQVNQLISPIKGMINTEQQANQKQKINLNPTKTFYNQKIVNNSEEYFQYMNNQSLNKTQIKFQKLFSKELENDEQIGLQNININNKPSYEVAHKSFKKYNIPITLRSNSFNKRQITSRKSSNTSPDSTTNRSSTSNKSINETLLFNIYKPVQVPSIQQRLNVFIQSQEEHQKSKLVEYSQDEQENFKLNKNILCSPLNRRQYYKYKPQTSTGMRSTSYNKNNNSIVKDNWQSVTSNGYK